jgi:hypothetical protein
MGRVSTGGKGSHGSVVTTLDHNHCGAVAAVTVFKMSCFEDPLGRMQAQPGFLKPEMVSTERCACKGTPLLEHCTCQLLEAVHMPSGAP